MATVVEDQRVPIWVIALTWIRVLVEVGPIEEAKTMLITGKMRGHPIQDYANPLLMKMIDKIAKIIWASVAAGRAEIACRLIAPGGIVGVLRDGEQLNMSITHLLEVAAEPFSQFSIVERAITLLRDTHPGAQMNLIDGDGGFVSLPAFALLHPNLIAPLMARLINHRSGPRRGL